MITPAVQAFLVRIMLNCICAFAFLLLGWLGLYKTVSGMGFYGVLGSHLGAFVLILSIPCLDLECCLG
jgi:hypothetical protein